MYRLLFILMMLYTPFAYSQSYSETLYLYREQYKKDMYSDEHSPLHKGDTAALRFYAPDEHFVVTATLILTPASPPFDMLTHSGKKKVFRQYAIARFQLAGKEYALRIYQNMGLIKKEEYRKNLFLPFNDLTNYITTYAGGRYIDLSTDDVKEATVVIDFNKCYNPYCAFGGSYSCPIPPEENKLQTAIEAGEQLFAGKVKE